MCVKSNKILLHYTVDCQKIETFIKLTDFKTFDRDYVLNENALQNCRCFRAKMKNVLITMARRESAMQLQSNILTKHNYTVFGLDI